MHSFFRSFSAAILASLLSPMTAGAETLSDALAQAYRNSGLIEQNRAVLRAADEDVAQAVTALRPVLSYSAGMTYGRLGEPGLPVLEEVPNVG